jgi:anti-sigma regulatory factor (Ser/Thr protein kinase)
VFDHPALFYRDHDDYLDAVVPFIRAGLDAGEPVLVAVPEPNLGLLLDALGTDAAGIEMDDMGVAGRNPGRIIGTVLLPFADKHSGRRVRVVGEPIWLGRSVTEYPACAQHEALINVAFAGREATIVCPYHLDGLHPRIIEDAKRTHPALWQDDRRSASSRFGDPITVADSFNTTLPPAPLAAVKMSIHDLNLGDVRDFVTAHAIEFGLSKDRVDDAVLAVNELAANSLVHSGGAGRLAAWIDHGRVVFQVSDTGHIKDPLAGRIPAPVDQIGGRGLLFTHRLADLVRIHTVPGGTTVRVFFDLPGTERDYR